MGNRQTHGMQNNVQLWKGKSRISRKYWKWCPHGCGKKVHVTREILGVRTETSKKVYRRAVFYCEKCHTKFFILEGSRPRKDLAAMKYQSQSNPTLVSARQFRKKICDLYGITETVTTQRIGECYQMCHNKPKQSGVVW